MSRAAALIRDGATHEIEAGGVWWRVRRVNSMQILMSSGISLLPGAAEALEAKKAAPHRERGDEAEWRDKTAKKALSGLMAKPDQLLKLTEAAAATVCAGVTHALCPDDDAPHVDGERYLGEWERISVCMTQADAEADQDGVWVYDLTDDQRAVLAAKIQEMSSARAVRGFPRGST